MKLLACFGEEEGRRRCMKLYVIAGRGGGVQETSIRPFGQWELLSIHNISSVASEPERAAEARSAVVTSILNILKCITTNRHFDLYFKAI